MHYSRLRLAALVTRELSIAQGSVVFMAAFLISAATGLVRQVLFNAEFGAGMQASAYYAAFRLPDTLATLIAGGTLSSALLPVLLGVARARGEAAAARLVSLTLTTLLAIVAPVVVVCALLAPLFVRHVLAPGFDAATAELTVQLTRIMLCELLLLVVLGVSSTLLLSRNQFVLPALSIALHNLTLIGGILAARWMPGLGVYGPTLGTMSDSLLQIVVLAPGLRRLGYRYRFAWNPADDDLRAVLVLLGPRGLSAAINYAGVIVDTAFASLSPQAGALPALSNAYLLLGVPQRLLGLAAAQAATPRLAAYAVAGEWRRLRRTLFGVLAAAIALALPAVLLTVAVGRQAIGLLFERGRFDAAAADLTYLLLVAFMAALPGYVASELLTAGFVALRDTRTPLLTNVLQLAGRVGLIVVLIVPLGVLAIPVAFAATATLEAALLAVVLLRALRRYESCMSES